MQLIPSLAMMLKIIQFAYKLNLNKNGKRILFLFQQHKYNIRTKFHSC